MRKPPSGGEEEPGSSGRQPVAKLTEDEDTGALPSQPERDHCSTEGSTRRSERGRRTPGKFLDFISSVAGNTAGGHFTDTTMTADETTMVSALNAVAFMENLSSMSDSLKRVGDRNHWEKAIDSEMESLCKNRAWKPKKVKRGSFASSGDRYRCECAARVGEQDDHPVYETHEAWIVRLSGGVGWQPANQQAPWQRGC